MISHARLRRVLSRVSIEGSICLGGPFIFIFFIFVDALSFSPSETCEHIRFCDLRNFSSERSFRLRHRRFRGKIDATVGWHMLARRRIGCHPLSHEILRHRKSAVFTGFAEIRSFCSHVIENLNQGDSATIVFERVRHVRMPPMVMIEHRLR